MFRTHLFAYLAGVGVTFAFATAQKAKNIPTSLDDIHREAGGAMASKDGVELLDFRWGPAKKIARKYDRSAIDTLFKSASDLDQLPQDDAAHWSRRLAAYVIVQIADP